MKLNKNIYRSCSICGNGVVENNDNAVDIKYKADSQMLQDLIEMMSETDYWYLDANRFAELHTGFEKETSYKGSTPREAIQAAISKWKEKK